MPGYFKFAVLFCISLWLCASCGAPDHAGKSGDNHLPDTAAHYYTPLIIAYDTMSRAQRETLVRKVLATQKNNVSGPYEYYFKGLQYELARNKDSAQICYGLMHADSSMPELYSLQQAAIFACSISGESVVPAAEVSALLTVTKKAEEGKSAFLYQLYDLLANAYYINDNIDKAIAYTDLYFNHNPLRDKPFMQQRYHDISFMLAYKKRHAPAMQQHLNQAQALALRMGDSLALARTYDYESQLYAVQKKNGKAVESSRKFFRYMKEHNLLKKYVFNNIATAFIQNRQPDSAIYYFHQAILWARKRPGSDLFIEFQGLSESYRVKGDYKNTAIALDSAINILGRNTTAIEAAKIEELHTRYQTEKKDQAIASLQTTNKLNRKLITQQRWIFLAVSLLLGTLALIIYNSYRRKLLVAKNEKLLAENKKLLLEQKALQLQLDPHFIYNAVANMQGLISSDKKKEANAYLVTFSSLMRNMLELNRQDLISVREEVDALKSYIRLQQMRFEHAFDYHISTGDLDMDNILIPPMLVQPFVENAIEHGFKNITYKGMLQLMVTEAQGQLHIRIQDNGTGDVTKDKPTKKSLSGSIIQERLDVLFNQEKKSAYFTAQPNVGADATGYTVDLYIPLLTA